MTDVLIAGAGPTGLTAAIELVKRGLDIRIVDPVIEPTKQSRALGIQSRTLEIFEKMGVVEECLKKGRKLLGAYFYENGTKQAEINLSLLKAPYPFLLSLPQSETESILIKQLERLGKSVERGVTLSTIKGKEAVILDARGKEEVLSPAWIIACDGAHSAVRHSLNLSFKGAKFPEIFLLADVELDTSLVRERAHLFLSDQGLFGILPLPDENQFRLIAVREKDAPKKDLDPSLFQKELTSRTKISNCTIKKTIWTSEFQIHRRIVPTMRVGNVFLAGDAAHIHSPAGGQGLNNSVQDAFNLSWKLSLVHKKNPIPYCLTAMKKKGSRLPKRCF